jgi:hypothetical protein
MKRITYIAAVLLGMMACLASAQNSNPPEPSLGDYARAVRKDKPPSTTKQFDNDNLPMDDKLSVVGAAGTSADSAAGAANASPDAGASDKKADDKPAAIKPGETPEERQKTYDAWKDRIATQKEKIDALAKEVEKEQREYQLRQSAAYADVGSRLRGSGEWEKDDADYKKMIDEKKQAADNAKQELDNLQEEARKAGVPSSLRE